METNNKCREALNELLDVFNSGLVEYPNWCNNSDIAQIQNVIDKAGEALSAPPRNCDVGTAVEQAKRKMAFCYKQQGCDNCSLNKGAMLTQCALSWAQMPYEEGEKDGSK